MSRWAAILAGGAGTRFWPVSTRSHPKQFLPLAGTEPLLADAVARLEGLVPPARTLVLTGRHLLEATRSLLPHIPPGNVLAEPRAASTGPALTWATVHAATGDADASVLSLHADWVIEDPEGFRRTATVALETAEHHDVLVTVGIVPTRPDIGYGYIEPGSPLDDRARTVVRFSEKPDAARAAALVAEGALWNSGMFAWTARRFLEETAAHAPEIAPHLPRLETGDVDGFFEGVTPIAVDVSHLERSKRVAVVPGSFGWDDVGTWAALARIRAHDAADNVGVGRAILHESCNCVVWAGDDTVVLDGVRDLVVVRAGDVTLVTTRDRAPSLKALLDTLPDDLRNR